MFWASTLSEFITAHDGWCEAHGVKRKGEAPSRERIEELKRKYG